MTSTVNIVGEFIEVEHDNTNKVVNKYVDGVLRSSYPVDSIGRAKMIMKRQLK
jgi:hypothetical protein